MENDFQTEAHKSGGVFVSVNDKEIGFVGRDDFPGKWYWSWEEEDMFSVASYETQEDAVKALIEKHLEFINR